MTRGEPPSSDLLIDRTSRSEKDTDAIALELVRHLRPNDLLTLEGPLGAGKTRFTRGLVAALGADPRLVSSPTFVLLNIYPLPSTSGFTNLYHLDAYRLPGTDELEAIGFAELITQGGLVVLEWASRTPDAYSPSQYGQASRRCGLVTLDIEPLDETARHFTIRRRR